MQQYAAMWLKYNQQMSRPEARKSRSPVCQTTNGVTSYDQQGCICRKQMVKTPWYNVIHISEAQTQPMRGMSPKQHPRMTLRVSKLHLPTTRTFSIVRNDCSAIEPRKQTCLSSGHVFEAMVRGSIPSRLLRVSASSLCAARLTSKLKNVHGLHTKKIKVIKNMPHRFKFDGTKSTQLYFIPGWIHHVWKARILCWWIWSGVWWVFVGITSRSDLDGSTLSL